MQLCQSYQHEQQKGRKIMRNWTTLLQHLSENIYIFPKNAVAAAKFAFEFFIFIVLC